MEVTPQILHQMVRIRESEPIVFFEYVVIRPIGLGASAGLMMGDTSAGKLNKGHIVNAGVLVLLKSGLLKIMTTNGAILLEKQISFDLNPYNSGNDTIKCIISNPNPEEMFLLILTNNGRVLKYSIDLVRQQDQLDLDELS